MAPTRVTDLLRVGGGTREENRGRLLRAIMVNPGPQVYLSKRTRLSTATVSAAVADLAREGLVRADRVIAMTPTAGSAVGVELGFRHCVVVARRVEQSYADAQVQVRQVGALMGAQRWVEEVADAVSEAVGELGEEEIAAIGLGIPRMVNPQTGKLAPPFMPPWNDGEDPAQMLADDLRRRRRLMLTAPRVVVDNDANLAAYAESIYEFDSAEILIGIKASTGIGAGIVVGGNIFRGARGVAGEIGHTVVEPGGRFCSCGGRGCLETLIGADALVEQAKVALGHKRITSPQDLEELLHMAGQGNLACQRVLTEAAATLGSAIGNLCNVLNPNAVVLSGALGRPSAAEFVTEPLQAALRKYAMRAAAEDLTVSATRIPHPTAHGALAAALEGTWYPPSRESARSGPAGGRQAVP